MEGAVDHFASCNDLQHRLHLSRLGLRDWLLVINHIIAKCSCAPPRSLLLLTSGGALPLPQLSCRLPRLEAHLYSSLDTDTFRKLPLIRNHGFLIHLFGSSASFVSKSLCYVQRGPQVVTVRTHSTLRLHIHAARIILSCCSSSISKRHSLEIYHVGHLLTPGHFRADTFRLQPLRT